MDTQTPFINLRNSAEQLIFVETTSSSSKEILA